MVLTNGIILFAPAGIAKVTVRTGYSGAPLCPVINVNPLGRLVASEGQLTIENDIPGGAFATTAFDGVTIGWPISIASDMLPLFVETEV